MQNHTDSWETIDKKLQQSSHVFNDPVACYMEGFISSKLKPLVDDESENLDDDDFFVQIIPFLLASGGFIEEI